MDRSSALDAAGCTCWQRAARWVYRLVPGQVMLAAPGGEERAIQGLAPTGTPRRGLFRL